jgi:hypothetical protein
MIARCAEETQTGGSYVPDAFGDILAMAVFVRE